MLLTLDIETLPCIDPDFIADVAATITAPAQYKKADSIEAWLAENKVSVVNEKVSKTSFDGLYGSIACICYAVDDGEVHCVDVRAHGEKQMLENFYSHVLELSTEAIHGGLAEFSLTICGHNIAGFDLPFLKHRSIIHGVKPINQIMAAMNARAWEKNVADTMLMWSQDREKRASMDKICKALGIPGKGDFDGSMVADTWFADPMKVIEYCKQDVERTRQIYKRLTFQSADFIT